MRKNSLLLLGALVLGLSGASTLSAEERWGDSRDLRHDYDQTSRLRADVARDRAKLDEDIRCGRDSAAAQDARDLARDQNTLNALARDIRHDRTDIRRDHRW